MSKDPHATVVVPLEGTLYVEVNVDDDALEKLGSSGLATRLGDGIGAIRSAIRLLANQAAESVVDIRENFAVTELEIEAGLGIEAEGNVYLAKGTGSANLKVTFKIKPTSTQNAQ